ncbi:hypothetical protein D3C87_1319020 [compost metagenome]
MFDGLGFGQVKYFKEIRMYSRLTTRKLDHVWFAFIGYHHIHHFVDLLQRTVASIIW